MYIFVSGVEASGSLSIYSGTLGEASGRHMGGIWEASEYHSRNSHIPIAYPSHRPHHIPFTYTSHSLHIQYV